MSAKKLQSLRSRQRGAVLIVSLMMLLVMTLIGITAMNSTVLEEKMAGNTRQRQVAFQAAEAALRSAENWLLTNITTVTEFETAFNNTPAELYWERKPRPGSTLRQVAFDIYYAGAWAVGNSQEPAISVTSAPTDPRYLIEYLGRSGEPPLDVNDPDPRPYSFRITAIGWGMDNVTTYVAQSTFRIAL